MKKLIFIALLLLLSQPTFATCTSSSLTGSWAILGATNNEYGGFKGVGRGTVVISSTGIINSTKSAITYTLPNGTKIRTSLTGKVSVDSYCSVTASISSKRTSYIRGTTYSVSGQLNNSDKNMIASIYRTTDSDIGMLNWVKK